MEGETKKTRFNERWLPDPAQVPGFFVSVVGEGLLLGKVKPGLGKRTPGSGVAIPTVAELRWGFPIASQPTALRGPQG